MMSLASLLAIEQAWVWRASFAIFGLAGAVESALVIARGRRLGQPGPLVRAADWLSFAIYGLAALVAIWSDLPDELGIDLRARSSFEGMLVALLLLLGVSLAAALFVTTGPQTKRSGSFTE